MVLFPQSSGGYFGLPHGANSIKFAVRGDTLWESIWANVINAPENEGAPVPCDHMVFAWLDPSLREMPLGRKDESARRSVARSKLPSYFVPLPRRYLLGVQTTGLCDLTDVEGPSYTDYKRWPAGLQYEPRNWTMPFVAERKTYVFGASGWRPKTAASDSQEGNANGPEFVNANGPLRFDDWLEASLDEAREPPEQAELDQKYKSVDQPAAVVAFRKRAMLLTEVQKSTALVTEVGFRLEAIGANLDGKVMAAFSRRQLPLWYARDHLSHLGRDARFGRRHGRQPGQGDQNCHASGGEAKASRCRS
jgi:hypothetical protein